ncbi:uncharacterized protein [Primulina huaijiensis]|uniref:uncharacterized protein n=1 Tax=Primulina huaijiensis TaxID=1492673 RepID=UPI003CC6FFDA
MEKCVGIHTSLNLYERASGQLINFEKFLLSFSPNTNERVKDTIKTMFIVPVVQGHEVYLGFPVFSIRNKKLQFRYLVERVAKRLQEIERACANFWWDVDDGKNRMHWKSWKVVCKPKCMGGMGFSHLETFNKALLAIQIWCVIHFTARWLPVFSKQDIINIKISCMPHLEVILLTFEDQYCGVAPCWKKVYIGTWEMGNKLSFSRTNGYLVGEYSGNYEKVSSLVLNEQIVLDSFPPHVAAKILDIPISPSNHEDFIYWA